MADLTPNPELLRSLGRLARGLSCLFWGLPLALLVCVRGVQAVWLGRVGFFPPLVTTALLLYGVWRMGSFQRQERVWVTAQGRAQILALFNFGLSPFIYWWEQVPNNTYFAIAALMFNVGGLAFLYCLNTVLERLGAMLPDETLRQETRQFTAVNRWLIIVLLVGALLFEASMQSPGIISRYPHLLEHIHLNRQWLILTFVLFPVAMTMALIWKTKEVILGSVFGGQH